MTNSPPVTTLYVQPLSPVHDTGPGHPECHERLIALHQLFKEDHFSSFKQTNATQPAWDDIIRAHDTAYLFDLQDAMPDFGTRYLDPDTVVGPESWETAETAAGLVCRAVDDVITGECHRAFCAIRPPGHHAYADHAEGFCLLNNVCIGALRAVHHHGLKKVAILDFDVHHGNGTDSIARQHTELFYASTHQYPIYPHSGLPADDLSPRIFNRTMNAYEGSAAFRKHWEFLLEKMEAFAPDLIMISAGFDAHRDDPLAQINLTHEDFSWITEEIVKIAARICDGKIVSSLEGGYNLDILKAGVETHINALS